MKRIASLAVFAATAALAPAARADFVTVSLAPYANARIQTYQPTASQYPEGLVTLGGIPFNIQNVGGNNAWLAQNVAGAYPHILDVPLNIQSATEVHTLINTFYGRPGPTSYITLEFFGTGGAYYRKDLIGDIDVRDHFFGGNTNSINGTTTVNVFSTGGGQYVENRLDKQQIVLPSTFLGQTLTSFRLTSTGGVGISDATIQGLTVRTVPEPSSLALTAACLLLGGGGYLRKLHRRRIIDSVTATPTARDE